MFETIEPTAKDWKGGRKCHRRAQGAVVAVGGVRPLASAVNRRRSQGWGRTIGAPCVKTLGGLSVDRVEGGQCAAVGFRTLYAGARRSYAGSLNRVESLKLRVDSLRRTVGGDIWTMAWRRPTPALHDGDGCD